MQGDTAVYAGTLAIALAAAVFQRLGEAPPTSGMFPRRVAPAFLVRKQPGALEDVGAPCAFLQRQQANLEMPGRQNVDGLANLLEPPNRRWRSGSTYFSLGKKPSP
jgi:hypothetical protein